MSDAPTPNLNDILDRALAGGEDTAAAAAAPAEPTTPTPTSAAESTSPAEATEATEPGDDELLPPHVARELRKENQALRARAKRYEETFGSWSEDDRGTLLNLVTAIRDDPASANEWWQENIAGKLRGEEGPAAQKQAEQVVATIEAAGVEAPPSSAPAPQPSGLTRDELLQILDERDRKSKQESFLSDFQKTARELGYDPDSAMYVAMTHIAANQTGSDPKEADRILRGLAREFAGMTEEAKQEVVDQFVADKAKGDTTLPGVAGTPTPPAKEAPKSVKDADRQVRAFLEEQGLTGTKGR